MAAGRDGAAEDAHRAHVYAYTGAFFDELVQAGVETVCVSPGSRSTPLAVAAARTPGLRVVPIIDERSAGFFALGLARQSERPVALVCTSGTAAANYLPAVTEAHYARVPLIVCTADRPPELREWGAGQTIDQLGLYGRSVKRFVEVPVPAGGDALLRHARALAVRAAGDALAAPAGPVHLNWPFREPLDPPPAEASREAPEPERRPHARVTQAIASPTEADVEELVALVTSRPRGVIAAGPMPPSLERDAAIARLAAAAGWPIVADVTSGLRRGRHVPGSPILGHADLWLRDPKLADAFSPDVVLRFGDAPVSKSLRLWLEAKRPEAFVLVDADGGWQEPGHIASRVLRADPAVLAGEVSARLPAPVRSSAWCDEMLAADRRAAVGLEAAMANAAALDEPFAVRELVAHLPADATLFLSSSMPVRDADAFVPVAEPTLRVLCNRGANGIDGVTSSALGAAAAGRGPVVLVTGDLALLHDLGGLVAASTQGIPLLIVVLNNDGGGIFSFLPIAGHGDAVDFERLFRTPHGADLSGLATLLGVGHTRVASPADYVETLGRLLAAPLEGAHVVEVPIDRDANVARFRELAAVAQAAARGGGLG